MVARGSAPRTCGGQPATAHAADFKGAGNLQTGANRLLTPQRRAWAAPAAAVPAAACLKRGTPMSHARTVVEQPPPEAGATIARDHSKRRPSSAAPPTQRQSTRAANRASATLRGRRKGVREGLKSGRLTIRELVEPVDSRIASLKLVDLAEMVPGMAEGRIALLGEIAVVDGINLLERIGRSPLQARLWVAALTEQPKWLTITVHSYFSALERRERTPDAPLRVPLEWALPPEEVQDR